MKNFLFPIFLVSIVVLLSGCAQQSTTVTINQNGSAVVEKKLDMGSSISSAYGFSADIEQKFTDSLKRQKPVSVLRYKDANSGGIVGKFNIDSVVTKDIFASEDFFYSKDKKKLNCVKKHDLTECTGEFYVKIASEELNKFLEENSLTYDSLDPYILTFVLPKQATSHNAKFYDLEKNMYIWEIPAGKEIPISIKFKF